jgi:hypothetical protein
MITKFIAAMLSFVKIILFLPLVSLAQERFRGEKIYKFSKEIIDSLNEGDKVQITKALEDFSFIGDYKKILEFEGKTRQPFGSINQDDSVYFKKFHPVDAAEFIVKRAEKEQIIIINEAHHVPYHRIFIASILKGLYAKGFRYYGAEALDFSDSTINQRGHPLVNSGYYVAEPQFGNLIREAIRLGFILFAYEARTPESISNPKQREFEQAKNIQQILKHDPLAKILIHAGYDHIREDSLGGEWEKAMALRLRELTGINPFTINQEVLTERISPSLENPFYKMISVSVPSILVDELGNTFAGPQGTNYYDVRLCHPRTSYIEGRPHWLSSKNEKYVRLREKDLTVGFPCLLQAYNENEDPEITVPVDVVEITEKESPKPLILNPGKYNVLIKGINGRSKIVKLKITR